MWVKYCLWCVMGTLLEWVDISLCLPREWDNIPHTEHLLVWRTELSLFSWFSVPLPDLLYPQRTTYSKPSQQKHMLKNLVYVKVFLLGYNWNNFQPHYLDLGSDLQSYKEYIFSSALYPQRYPPSRREDMHRLAAGRVIKTHLLHYLICLSNLLGQAGRGLP